MIPELILGERPRVKEKAKCPECQCWTLRKQMPDDTHCPECYVWLNEGDADVES